VADVGAVPDHVGGAGMAKRMRRDLLPDPGLFGVVRDDLPYGIVMEFVSSLIEEEIACVVVFVFSFGDLGSNGDDVVMEHVTCYLSQGDDTVLFVFALLDPEEAVF